MIINYFHNVDDILLIFYFTHTNIQSIFTVLNSTHPNLHFTTEIESNNMINFINKTKYNTQISIFKKPTFTDTIIPYTSNHPTQHKYAANRYLHNRIHTHKLRNKAYNQEFNTMQNILYNNSYPIWPPNTPKSKKKYTTDPDLETSRQKWDTLIYYTNKLHTLPKYLNTPT